MRKLKSTSLMISVLIALSLVSITIIMPASASSEDPTAPVVSAQADSGLVAEAIPVVSEKMSGIVVDWARGGKSGRYEMDRDTALEAGIIIEITETQVRDCKGLIFELDETQARDCEPIEVETPETQLCESILVETPETQVYEIQSILLETSSLQDSEMSVEDVELNPPENAPPPEPPSITVQETPEEPIGVPMPIFDETAVKLTEIGALDLPENMPRLMPAPEPPENIPRLMPASELPDDVAQVRLMPDGDVPLPENTISLKSPEN